MFPGRDAPRRGGPNVRGPQEAPEEGPDEREGPLKGRARRGKAPGGAPGKERPKDGRVPRKGGHQPGWTKLSETTAR